MSKKITQWHPAFCSAMELEFIKEKGKLEYDLQGCPFFRAQIIVSSELDLKEHLWLKSLTSKMQEVEAEELIKRTQSLEEKGDKIKADSVLQVAVDENGVLFGRIKEDETVMCEALRELFKPELDEAVGAAVGAKEKEGIEILVETMRDMGGTDEAIVARLMEKYNLKEKDAKAYL